MRRIEWPKISMDLSIAAVQDVCAAYFRQPFEVCTIRVGEKSWDYARMDVAKWNQANLASPRAVVYNLYLEPSIDDYSWTFEVNDTQVLVKGA